MLESLFSTNGASTVTIEGFLIAIFLSLVLGGFISIVHLKAERKRTSQSFTITLVLLPAVISVIIMLVGTNVASAFSLAGAFSIIRFRSAPGEPKDITYVLFSLAVGLANGLGFYVHSIIVAVLLSLVMFMLEYIKFGAPKATTDKILKITMPENLDYQNAFDDIFSEYTVSHNLNKVKTTDLGSLYELEYSVTTNDSKNEKEFIDELRCRNGNLNITLILSPQKEYKYY